MLMESHILSEYFQKAELEKMAKIRAEFYKPFR